MRSSYATAAKLANQTLTVIVKSGDGCVYGEGGKHFFAAIRRNISVTLIVHNNQVYGLTKGQASPTSMERFVTKAQPEGVHSTQFNPVAVPVAMQAGFVARNPSGMGDHLSKMIQEGIAHKGFTVIDVLQPCISFNRINTYKWHKDWCSEVPGDHDPANRESAMKLAFHWGDEIPVGIKIKGRINPCHVETDGCRTRI